MSTETQPKYRKRGGAAGASGHFLEINLLALFKLQGDKKLKDFYLAGNLQAAGDFDDVVFRYTNDQGGEIVVFLQAKSKEDTKQKLTIDKFRKGGKLDLPKYFKSFSKIQDQFKEPQTNDRIFRGKDDNHLQCNFIIYTNQIADDTLLEFAVEGVTNPLDMFFGKRYGQALRLDKIAVKEIFRQARDDDEVEKVMAWLKAISGIKCKTLKGDENFAMYHAFFTHTIFLKHDDDYWKLRDEFFKKDLQNEALAKLREKIVDWYAEAKLHAEKNTIKRESESATIKLKEWKVELPDWFEKRTQMFDRGMCDKFVEIARDCISDNVCTISKFDKKLKKKVAELVGTVFVFDEKMKMFKLNDKKIDGEHAKVLEYLQGKFGTSGLRFDFKLDKFPRLSLGFTPIDEEAVVHFSSKLTILTGQLDSNGLEKMINSTSLGNVSEGEAARRYSLVKQKITEWWMKSGEVDYLRKNDGFLDKIMTGIVFNLKGNMKSFIGRKTELEKLHSDLQNSEAYNKTVVISQMASVSGLGGIGKTELARKYAHDYQGSYDGNVIWIDADNHESMVECFHRLCKDSLNISTEDANNKEKDATSIVQEVYNFFQNRKSLFIFDNANRFKNIGNTTDGIEPFLPATETGLTVPHFIVTSRNQRWPNALLELDIFMDAEAEQLVKRQLEINDCEQDASIKELIKQLHNFPLALQQSIAYIREKDKMNRRATGVHFTIKDCLKLLTEKTEQLLKYKFPTDFPDHYTKTTFMTWNITLEEIAKHKLGQKAKKILNIMAFLSPNDIPIQFFRDSVDISGEELIKVVNLLAKYSMISLHEGVADIHRLVQWVGRHKLSDIEKKDVLKAGLQLVNMHTDEKLINHGAPLWNCACRNDDLVREFNKVPAKIIKALKDSLRYEEANAFGMKSVGLLKRVLGNEHKSSLTAQTELAKVMDNLGKYAAAFIAFRYIFDIHKRDLGTDNALTIDAWHSIAQTLSHQGKYDEALATYKEVFEKLIKILGPGNPSTLVTQHNIAQTLSDQGKYDEALAAYQEVFEKKKKILGPDNPSTLATQHNIAQTLSRQGKNHESLATCKEVFKKKIKILGQDNPSTLITQHDIAQTLSKQGKHDEALVTYQEVFEKQINILGPDNTSTLTTQHSIAQTLSNQGKHDEALAAYHSVFEMKNKILGPDNPSTSVTQHNIAQTLSDQGKHDEALATYQEVFQKEIKILGPDNPSTLVTQHNIAQTLSNQGKHDEALATYKEVFEKQIKILGPYNPSTLTTQHRITEIEAKQRIINRNGKCTLM